MKRATLIEECLCGQNRNYVFEYRCILDIHPVMLDNMGRLHKALLPRPKCHHVKEERLYAGSAVAGWAGHPVSMGQNQ